MMDFYITCWKQLCLELEILLIIAFENVSFGTETKVGDYYLLCLLPISTLELQPNSVVIILVHSTYCQYMFDNFN